MNKILIHPIYDDFVVGGFGKIDIVQPSLEVYKIPIIP